MPLILCYSCVNWTQSLCKNSGRIAMAVPKNKVSKQRSNKRFANWKVSTPNLSECSQCKELIPGHTVCSNCGYYNGRQVVVKKEKEDK